MHYLWSQIPREACWNVSGMLRYENRWIICQLFPGLWKSALHGSPSSLKKLESTGYNMSVIYEASGNWQTTQVMLALEHFTKWPWCRAPSVFKCLKWPFKCMELIVHEDAQIYCTSQWFSLLSVSFSASHVSVTITFYVTPPKPCKLSNIVEQLWCFPRKAF